MYRVWLIIIVYDLFFLLLLLMLLVDFLSLSIGKVLSSIISFIAGTSQRIWRSSQSRNGCRKGTSSRWETLVKWLKRCRSIRKNWANTRLICTSRKIAWPHTKDMLISSARLNRLESCVHFKRSKVLYFIKYLFGAGR